MKTLAIVLIKSYQWLFSPRRGVLRFIYSSALFSLNPGWLAGCRQYPTCSDYCLGVVKQHGLYKGLRMSWARIINCR